MLTLAVRRRDGEFVNWLLDTQDRGLLGQEGLESAAAQQAAVESGQLEIARLLQERRQVAFPGWKLVRAWNSALRGELEVALERIVELLASDLAGPDLAPVRFRLDGVAYELPYPRRALLAVEAAILETLPGDHTLQIDAALLALQANLPPGPDREDHTLYLRWPKGEAVDVVEICYLSHSAVESARRFSRSPRVRWRERRSAWRGEAGLDFEAVVR